MLKLSKEQKKVTETLIDWVKNPKEQFITLGGYAGTGKTTVISKFRSILNEENKELNVAFVSYTGKATRVLGDKLTEAKARSYKDTVSTIHGLLYDPIENDKAEIVGWERKKEVKTDLIIIDEASMVDSEIWKDLTSFGIPIIAVGDHGQLPPIKGSFNLMDEPMLKLEEIHRQAKGNPIIQISEIVRNEGNIPINKWNSRVKKIDRYSQDAGSEIIDILESSKNDSMILCGFNTTRNKLNAYMRNINEHFSESPVIGDKVICLRNNHEKQIYNGMIGQLNSIEVEDSDTAFVKITMDDGDIYQGSIYLPQFGNPQSLNFTDQRGQVGNRDLFDFGYAMTVHKSQGSQAKRVVLFEERSQHMDDDMWRRWLYTGVTRAEEELFVIKNQR